MAIRTRPEHAVARIRRVAARERIRLHLVSAEVLLRLRGPPPGADPSRRTAHLDALRTYWRRGDFPTNRDFPAPTPYFRDADGVQYAVAELAAADGREDVVDAVAHDANHVDLETDEPPPALEAWLADAPLTEREAAYVQPAYPPGPPAWATEALAVLLVGVVSFLDVQFRSSQRRGDDRVRRRNAAVYYGRSPATAYCQYTVAVALALTTALLLEMRASVTLADAGLEISSILVLGGVVFGVGVVAAAVGASRNSGLVPAWVLGNAPLIGTGLAFSLEHRGFLPLLAVGTVGFLIYGLPAATFGYLLGLAVGDEERAPRPSRRALLFLAGYVAVHSVVLLALQLQWVVL